MPSSRLDRFLLAATIFAVLAPARPSGAAPSRHQDLLTTTLASKDVVRARVVGEPHVSAPSERTQVVVEESYRGTLAPGSELDLDLDLYSFAPTPDVELVLFLAPNADGRRPVGVRLLQAGHAADFRPWSNPGSLAPAVQPREPGDIFALFRNPHRSATVDEFEEDLRSTLARADAIRRALAEPPSRERRDTLVELVGPRPDSTDGVRPDDGEDPPTAILQAFEEEEDVVGFVEAYSRSAHPIYLEGLGEHIPRRSFLAAARDPSLDPLARLAALRLFGKETDDIFPRSNDEPAPWADALALLDDPEPLVRRGVLEQAYAQGDVPPEFLQLLVHRFTRESTAHVKAALHRRMGELGVLDRSWLPFPALPDMDAGRVGRRLWITWDNVDADRPWTIAAVTLNLRLRGGSGDWTTIPISGTGVPSIDLAVGRGEWKEDLPAGQQWTTGTYDTYLGATFERPGEQVPEQMDIGPLTVHVTAEEDDWRPLPPVAARPAPPAPTERSPWAAMASVVLLLGSAAAVWRWSGRSVRHRR